MQGAIFNYNSFLLFFISLKNDYTKEELVQTVSTRAKKIITLQKNHQLVFAALFEFLISHICHKKKLDDFSAKKIDQNYKNCIKKGEDGLDEQRYFVG